MSFSISEIINKFYGIDNNFVIEKYNRSYDDKEYFEGNLFNGIPHGNGTKEYPLVYAGSEKNWFHGNWERGIFQGGLAKIHFAIDNHGLNVMYYLGEVNEQYVPHGHGKIFVQQDGDQQTFTVKCRNGEICCELGNFDVNEVNRSLHEVSSYFYQRQWEEVNSYKVSTTARKSLTNVNECQAEASMCEKRVREVDSWLEFEEPVKKRRKISHQSQKLQPLSLNVRVKAPASWSALLDVASSYFEEECKEEEKNRHQ